MIGHGDPRVAISLYSTAILVQVADMRRQSEYVCFSNLSRRMPDYNVAILKEAFYDLALSGQL